MSARPGHTRDGIDPDWRARLPQVVEEPPGEPSGRRPPFVDDAGGAGRGRGGNVRPEPAAPKESRFHRDPVSGEARGAGMDGRPKPKPGVNLGPRRRRAPFVVVVVLVTLVVLGAIGYAILSNTSAFVIGSIVCEATEHMSSEDIATLAAVPEGTTLLNYDATAIEANLRRNPWVGGVEIIREYPDRLRITVRERTVVALVPLNSGAVVWCLGSDGVWIEPTKVSQEESQTVVEAALEEARRRGALLITDVSTAVSPVAGEPAADEVFQAISDYRLNLSAALWEQVVSISAPSVEGISLTLLSGVEISMGSPSSIASKEAIVEQLLAKYPGKLTYINVRVPSNPSYRMIDSETVQGGTGILSERYGQSLDPDAHADDEDEAVDGEPEGDAGDGGLDEGEASEDDVSSGSAGEEEMPVLEDEEDYVSSGEEESQAEDEAI